MQSERIKYTIGEISKITNLNKKTLRFYDEKGILKPLKRDEYNNYRYYSEQEILKALVIREMRLRGFTLSELRNLFPSQDLVSLKGHLENKVDDLVKELEIAQEKLRYIQNTYDHISDVISILDGKNENRETLEISIMHERTVLFTRYVSRVYAEKLFWDRYSEILNLRDQEGILSVGPFGAIFHDHYLNQFFSEKGDLEVFLPISGGDLKKEYVKKIGGFLVGSMVFVGRYYDLFQTYVELAKQIKENGYEIIGPAIEEYLIEFSYGIEDDECITRVSFPIKKCC